MKIVGYYSNRIYNSDTHKREADWDNADNCSRCNKKLIDVYEILADDNKYLLVGYECLKVFQGLRIDKKVARDLRIGVFISKQQYITYRK